MRLAMRILPADPPQEDFVARHETAARAKILLLRSIAGAPELPVPAEVSVLISQSDVVYDLQVLKRRIHREERTAAFKRYVRRDRYEFTLVLPFLPCNHLRAPGTYHWTFAAEGGLPNVEGGSWDLWVDTDVCACKQKNWEEETHLEEMLERKTWETLREGLERKEVVDEKWPSLHNER